MGDLLTIWARRTRTKTDVDSGGLAVWKLYKKIIINERKKDRKKIKNMIIITIIIMSLNRMPPADCAGNMMGNGGLRDSISRRLRAEMSIHARTRTVVSLSQYSKRPWSAVIFIIANLTLLGGGPVLVCIITDEKNT